MAKANPIVHGRMYKVAGDRNVKGIRLNKNGTTDIVFVPDRNARNPYYNVGGKEVQARSMRAALKKALKANRKRNVAAGFVDEEGVFHPIRASYDYSAKRAGEAKKKRAKANRKRNVAAGFVDEEGVFHPIRASYDYSAKRAGEAKKRTAKPRKTKATKNTRKRASKKK